MAVAFARAGAPSDVVAEATVDGGADDSTDQDNGSAS